MNVLYIATDSYLPLLGISMISLLENTPASSPGASGEKKDSAPPAIYVLSPDLTEESRQTLNHLAAPYGAQVHCISIAGFEKYFPAALNTSGFHPIVLARLVVDKYLPDTLNSILYLDCDVIVDGPIDVLDVDSRTGNSSSKSQAGTYSDGGQAGNFSASRHTDSPKRMPLGRYAFAAVPELCMPDAQKAYIGLSPQDTYYNAGVVLLNLAYWRKHHLSERCVKYANQMQGKLLYNDQDVLNHCCKGEILRLSHRYNFSPVLRCFPRWFIRTYQPLYYCRSAKQYRQILRHPSIIHYLGDERPWMNGNHNPYRDRYLHYRNLSPWKDRPLKEGREFYLFCYHMLNLITGICPWFRKYFTKFIGIRYYRLFGKK